MATDPPLCLLKEPVDGGGHPHRAGDQVYCRGSLNQHHFLPGGPLEKWPKSTVRRRKPRSGCSVKRLCVKVNPEKQL